MKNKDLFKKHFKKRVLDAIKRDKSVEIPDDLMCLIDKKSDSVIEDLIYTNDKYKEFYSRSELKSFLSVLVKVKAVSLAKKINQDLK